MAKDLGDNGLDALEVACDLTLQTGVISAAIVLNEMRRLTEAAKPKALNETLASTPTLTLEPVAVTIAYGALAMSIDRAAQLKNAPVRYGSNLERVARRIHATAKTGHAGSLAGSPD